MKSKMTQEQINEYFDNLVAKALSDAEEDDKKREEDNYIGSKEEKINNGWY